VIQLLSITLAQITNPVIGNLGIGTEAQAPTSVAQIIATIIRFFIVIGGILLLFQLIRGGTNWILSEGKPDKLEQAQNEIREAIIGFLILAASIAIVNFLGSIFGLDILSIDIPTVNEL